MLLSNNKPNFLAINYNLIQNSKSISNFQTIYSKIQTEYNPIIKILTNCTIQPKLI